MKQWLCSLLKHKYEDAGFSYWMFKDDTWQRIEEPAQYCPRCGRVFVRNSEYFKSFNSGEAWLLK